MTIETTETAATRHEPFCLYPFTSDSRDMRPVACGACGAIWNREHREPEPEIGCWGAPIGSTANGVLNLIWIAAIIGTVIAVIVMKA